MQALGQKIAIVNHDPVFLELIRKVIDKAGFTALVCPSGTAAQQIIRDEQPAMVLIDIWLDTNEDGRKVIQTLRLDEKTSHIPILVSTFDRTEGDYTSTQPPDLVQFIYKPFEPESLVKQIREILTQRNA